MVETLLVQYPSYFGVTIPRSRSIQKKKLYKHFCITEDPRNGKKAQKAFQKYFKL